MNWSLMKFNGIMPFIIIYWFNFLHFRLLRHLIILHLNLQVIHLLLTNHITLAIQVTLNWDIHHILNFHLGYIPKNIVHNIFKYSLLGLFDFPLKIFYSSSSLISFSFHILNLIFQFLVFFNEFYHFWLSWPINIITIQSIYLVLGLVSVLT